MLLAYRRGVTVGSAWLLVLSLQQCLAAANLNEVLFFAVVSFAALLLTVVTAGIWLYLFRHCSRGGSDDGKSGSDISGTAGDGVDAYVQSGAGA
ncbi:MAG: hypothetical protein IAB19_00015 [Proteobacteria bacterium]|uniref:Uncharacterized protein n=1 Tax=Candidatus Avisuccinivibrio stercorigallinarum TaxID=2840704 RepID=A0A9D9D7L3_9GAMM|nr:hypothetical protein [Candidatus Avisuccinivibrio stercorigallinarum]